MGAHQNEEAPRSPPPRATGDARRRSGSGAGPARRPGIDAGDPRSSATRSSSSATSSSRYISWPTVACATRSGQASSPATAERFARLDGPLRAARRRLRRLGLKPRWPISTQRSMLLWMPPMAARPRARTSILGVVPRGPSTAAGRLRPNLSNFLTPGKWEFEAVRCETARLWVVGRRGCRLSGVEVVGCRVEVGAVEVVGLRGRFCPSYCKSYE